MEKRKFERVPLDESVVLVIDAGEKVVGQARDISIGGMFIEGVASQFGQHVVVHVHLADDGGAVELPAIVRWVRDNGVGVQFQMLGARETHFITEVIAQAAPSHTRIVATATDIELTS